MKHTTSRILFGYWDSLRGERSAPDRAAVQPGAIRHVLADTFLLGLEPGEPPAFRIAGSRVCALFGRELKGKPLAELWPREHASDVAGYVDVVTLDGWGVVLGMMAENCLGDQIALEMVLLPLRHAGRTRSRIIGVLSPAAVPSWAGLTPVGPLATRAMRVVQPTRATPPRFVPPLPDGKRQVEEAEERRRRFVVHQGGRAAGHNEEVSQPFVAL